VLQIYNHECRYRYNVVIQLFVKIILAVEYIMIGTIIANIININIIYREREMDVYYLIGNRGLT